MGKDGFIRRMESSDELEAIMTPLVIYKEKGGKYRLQWELPNDAGGYLCQDTRDGKGEIPCSYTETEEWEHWIASRVVRKSKNAEEDILSVFWWKYDDVLAAKEEAEKALGLDKSLPAWAQIASIEGWTMPDGWKP